MALPTCNPSGFVVIYIHGVEKSAYTKRKGCVNMTNKQQFIQEVETLKGQLSSDALAYFESVIKAKKVNKKEQEKAQVMRQAILDFLKENAGKMFDRVEIGNALYAKAEFEEEFLLNEKGEIAFNSITAFANQLAGDGLVSKQEVKIGKSTKIKYSV